MSERNLRRVSVIYLLAPNLLFYYSWVSLPLGALGILTLLYLAARECMDTSFETNIKLYKKDFLAIAITSLFLTIFSGINGYVFQNIDYWAHNAKFYELFANEWPIRIPQDGPAISYYYGYYLIPSLLSKLTGSVNEFSIFLWTWLGLCIGIAWVYLVLNRKIQFVLLTLCIGDLPRVIKSVLGAFSIRLYEFGDFGIENWSNFENLLWVPNQVIPTLILGGMFVYVLIRKLNIDLLVLPIALSFWWAVFPAFVCGLLIGGLVLSDWIRARFQLKWERIFNKVIIPFLVCFPILLFYLSHNGELVSGFLWQFSSDKANSFTEYLINVGTNALLFLAAYLYFRKINMPYLNQIPFFCIILLQLLFPIYRLGEVSDFLFRGMMPFLLIVGMYLFYPLSLYSSNKTYHILKTSGVATALALLLVCSSLTAVTQILRAMKTNRFSSTWGVPFEPIPYDAYDNVYEVLKVKWSQKGADQYLGDEDSFYEKFMAPDLKKVGVIKKQE